MAKFICIKIHAFEIFLRIYSFLGARRLGGGADPEGTWPPTSISESTEVDQFQFQASGIFLFTCVQRLYGPADFTIFTVHATIFRQFTAAFHFF